MRTTLLRHRWATIAVVVLLLFATSGMALSRMTCLMSGHSTVALGMLEDCCPEPEPTEGASIAPVCCVFGQAALDVEPFMPVSSMELVPLLACTIGLRPVHLVPLDGTGAERTLGTAPPVMVARRLALHSTYRI
jgi:hypothetical protein